MQITDETFELQGLLQLLESGTPLPPNFPALIVAKAESILALAREITLPTPEAQPAETPADPPAQPRIRLALNDRIRFTRELFAGDQDRLNEILAHISSIPWPQAQDYLLSDLNWDPATPEIAEFIEILHNLHTHRR
ncbi:MAG: hypothetical protein HDS26_06365 [Bacteroides sp.]|nr:hypothetical protein [Bacteroides sp.]